MILLPTYETPATRELNLEIAKKSKGVAFLFFSRGKDSLCSWLNMRRYFKRIIPVHCTTHPGLKHVDDTLDYYERVMETRIVRLCGEELRLALPRLMYQLPDDAEECTQLDGTLYSKLDILEYLRYQFNLPNAWCGVGMNIFDSIDRRIYINKCGGKNENNRTWYPCFDWPRPEILRTLRESGVKLSGEYRWTSRTLGGVPSYTTNKVYAEHYPEDWERILSYYPLAQAKNIRERMLDKIYARRRAEGIVADGAEESDDGSDAMPEFGMGDGGTEGAA